VGGTGRCPRRANDPRNATEQSTTGAHMDAQLLDQFVTYRDERAFEALVARHGPMVLGVCRQVLNDPHDADDAFQATFVVLARRAGSIRNPPVVGTWLYGVASRIARQIRSDAARRRQIERKQGEVHAREQSVEVSPVESDADDEARKELRLALHEELARLPDKYRSPIVLCYLQGQTHEQAAAQLRWPVGTVKGRLSRARELLQRRLSRRPLAIPATQCIVALSRDALADVPRTLRETTVRAAVSIARGEPIPVGVGGIPSRVLALARRASASPLARLAAGALNRRTSRPGP
jgi:RNA polymerase sigma factor (sigma-70 family)